jgi:anhydro-N-acetylmuramic acid kinase
MSGTSVDAIDSVLISIAGDRFDLLHTHEHPIQDSLREKIAGISHPGDNEIQHLGPLDRELGEMFAQAVNELLAGTSTTPSQVTAIGSHGQTIRHLPPGENTNGFTLQIGDPNTIAELTGIATVADFRRRDMACGGQGAPLAPAFHAAVFGVAGIDRAIVNIGGVANATLLQGERLIGGFDTGPGNTLLDHWHARCRGNIFDRDGKWAASGQPVRALLSDLRPPQYRKGVFQPVLARTAPGTARRPRTG